MSSEAPEILRRPDTTSVAVRGSSPSSMGSGGIKQIIMSAIIAAVVCFAMVQFVFIPSLVSKKDFTANLGSMTDALTVVKNAQKGDEGTLSNVSSQLTAISKQIQDMQSSYNIINTTVSGYNTKLSNLPNQTDIDSLKTSVTSLTAKVNGLPSTDYSTQITSINADLKTLTGKLDALQTNADTGNGTGTGTGTTTTNGNLSVALQPGWGGSTPIMAFVANASNISVTQQGTFGFRITNSSTSTASKIQLNIGLAYLNATGSGTITIPSGVTVTMSLISSPMTNWVSVYTGSYVMGYSNSAPVIGTLGEISQISGTSAVQTITITVVTPAGTPAFSIYPTVEVASYS